MIDVVLYADDELCGTAWHVSLASLSTSDIILCDRCWETLHELCFVTVVNLECQLALFIVELKLLDKWEPLAEPEEVAVLLGVFWLSCLQVGKLVVDCHWEVVVVFHLEVRDIEEWSHHGRVESCTSCDALDSVKRALKLWLLEDLFDDCIYDWGTCAVSNKLNKMNLIR